MRNLFVELYLPNKEKLGFIAETSEEIRAFLLSYVLPEKANSVIDNLEKQRENPLSFPNVVLFL